MVAGIKSVVSGVPRCLGLAFASVVAVVMMLHLVGHISLHTRYIASVCELHSNSSGTRPKVKVFGPTNVEFAVEVDDKFLEWMKPYMFGPEYRERAVQVMEAFGALADSLNVSWYMCCGALVGSYRHHQMTPWDLDLDVCVPRKDSEKLIKAYSRLNSTLFGYETAQKPLISKLYHKANYNNGRSHRVPQLDVLFQEESKTHHQQAGEQVWHKLSNIYPLVKRPFNGRMFPAPRDPRRHLAERYGRDKNGFFPEIDECPFMNWDQKHARFKPKKDSDVSVACHKLVKHFPFVKHSRGPAGTYCQEELVFQGEVIDSFMRNASDIPFC